MAKITPQRPPPQRRLTKVTSIILPKPILLNFGKLLCFDFIRRKMK